MISSGNIGDGTSAVVSDTDLIKTVTSSECRRRLLVLEVERL